MKKYVIFLLSMVCACQEYDATAPDPCLRAEASSGEAGLMETTTFQVGEPVTISSCGNADLYAIYTGDEGHVYGDDGATGVNLSHDKDAVYEYTYSTPGTYQLTLVATNTSTGSTEVETNIKIVTQQITITE